MLEDLEKLQKMFSKAEAWTQGVYARNANDSPTYVGDSEATCYCLVGAIREISPFSSHCEKLIRVLASVPIVQHYKDDALPKLIGNQYEKNWSLLVHFNDAAVSVETIRIAIDQAITMEEQRA